MYNVFTDIANLNTRNIEDIEDARKIAEAYAAHGYIVEIRDDETDETIELYNVKD